uniref:Thioredoxin domain-containing protein n=1 Tax=Panagrolaimus sp. ES5 TaxID=591445 RepID=A0AC34GTY1_9BILA
MKLLSFLFLLFLPLISSTSTLVQDILKPLSRAENSTETCPKYNKFIYYSLKQCPNFSQTCCSSRLPFDEDYKSTLTCTAIGNFPNNSLHLLSSDEFLQMTKERDSCGRPWCMLSLFYSKQCIYSAKVADRFAELALMYPNMVVVAVDAAAKENNVETLISHYGIAATPVIVLWENGYPRYKVTETPGDFDSLVRVLQQRSDLRPARQWIKDACIDGECEIPADVIPINKSNVLRQSFNLDEYKQTYDWYLIAASVALIIQGLYLIEIKRQEGIPWKNFNFGF